MTTPQIQPDEAAVRAAAESCYPHRFNGELDAALRRSRSFNEEQAQEHAAASQKEACDATRELVTAYLNADPHDELRAEAFNRGLNTGIGYKAAQDILGAAAPEPENPYRTRGE